MVQSCVAALLVLVLASPGSDELYQAGSSLLVGQVCKTGHRFHLQGKFAQEVGSLVDAKGTGRP